VDDALRYALVIEVLQLFDQQMIFNQDRASIIGLEGILIVPNDKAPLVR
jgi:hypothetical protein